jgi:hypothetical protein
MNLDLLHDSVIIFQGILIEALPFLLLGVLASAVLGSFVPERWLLWFMPRNVILGSLAGISLGFVFPVCECGNIPLARRLILKGVRPHVAVAFLLAAPVFNPIVIAATLAAFQHQPVILYLRLAFTLIVALVVGFLFSLGKPEDILRQRIIGGIAPVTETLGSMSARWRNFSATIVRELFEMGGALVLGGLAAAFIQVLVPRSILTSVGSGPVSSIVAMLGLAGTVSICSNVDAFFALGYSTTFTTGSILAFLVFGPMIDIKSLFMLNTIFRVRGIVWITVLTAELTFLLTLFYNLNVG